MVLSWIDGDVGRGGEDRRGREGRKEEGRGGEKREEERRGHTCAENEEDKHC